LLWFLIVGSSEVFKQLADLVTTSPVRLYKGRYFLLVKVVHVCTSLQQKLTHIEVVSLDCIINRGLSVVIHEVRICALFNHQIGCLKMIVLGDIEERSLAISVYMVDVAAVVNEILDDLRLSFPCCVIQWRLLEVVDIVRLAACLDQKAYHVKSRSLVCNHDSLKKRVLVIRHVIHVRYFHVQLRHFVTNLLQVPRFNLVEERLYQIQNVRQWSLVFVGLHVPWRVFFELGTSNYTLTCPFHENWQILLLVLF
jgi:hypothetical protein